MANYRHTYRCRCGDWDKNRIEIYTESPDPPFRRTQHFQVHEGVGLHPGCQNWITWLKQDLHKGSVPPSSRIADKPSRQVTPNSALQTVAFGPTLLTHVLKGEISADGKATGFHTLTETTGRGTGGTGPWAIKGEAHALAEWEILGRPDEWGVYYILFRFSYGPATARTTTDWKVSTMFPDRMSGAAVERAIRTAAVNRRTDPSSSVNWAGLHDNGMRVGGRSSPGGILQSAFPAYRGTFDIPDFVAARL